MLSIVGIGYSIYSLYGHFNEYRVSAEKYTQLHYIYENTAETEKHKELTVVNEDYLGWLAVEGAGVEYPVVQSSDNDFYLTHNFYQEYDLAGAIFMDYRNSREKLDTHTIIYGHNLKDKSMFGRLSDILTDDFSEGNVITFDFNNETYEGEIFSAYVTRDVDWMDIDFDTPEAYGQFLDQMMSKSARDFTIEVNEEDQIITLATCTSRVTDERVVIHAKLSKEKK